MEHNNDSEKVCRHIQDLQAHEKDYNDSKPQEYFNKMRLEMWAITLKTK